MSMSQPYAQPALPSSRQPEARAPGLSNIVYPLLGLGIAAIVPGIFWTALIGLAASGAGYAMDGTTLAAIAIAITGFLSLIWATIARRISSDEHDAA